MTLALELLHLLPAIGVLLILVSVLMSLRKKKQKMGKQITAREQVERSRQERAMRGDLEHLMVEIEQLTRRFSAQLDAKAMHVEKLIREADQRIARLEEMESQVRSRDGAGSAEPVMSSRLTAELESAREPAEASDPLSRSVCKLADEGLDPREIAGRLGEHVGKVELILALRRV
ncbi:MAG: hypothetical protein ACLFV3_06125 [Phycisphaeraceae bacterium]